MWYKEYLETDEWKDTKKYLKYVKKKRCYVCGRKKFLHVHHLHYRTVGYEDGSELMYLCRKHHKKIHFHTGKKIIPDTPEQEKVMRKTLKEWKNESYLQTEIVKRLFF